MKKIFCKINKIKKCGHSTVYDVTVEETHRLLANNFYTSNCNINHPDIEEFIEKKQDLTKVTGANVSVQITDDFMRAVENDEDYILKWPVDACINEHYTEIANDCFMNKCEYGKLYKMCYTETVFSSMMKQGYMKRVRAKDIWDKIIHCAWNTAEPGVLFRDRHLNMSPDGIYDKYKGVSTNPCVTGDTKICVCYQEKYGASTQYYDNITVEELLNMWNNRKDGEIYKILSYSVENNKIEYNKITNVQITKKTNKLFNLIVNRIDNYDDTLKCTPNHKIYTINNDYVEADKLSYDDTLITCYGPYNKRGVYKDSHMQKLSEEFTLNTEVDVYDITVYRVHNYFANNILVKNCGEIFMSGQESCRLLAINMLSFVDDAFTKDAKINVNTVYNITYEAMRLADDLVDLENEAVQRIIDVVSDDNYAVNIWSKILEKGQNGRRVGLEFTAMSDMIAALNEKFCTENANRIIDNVTRLMMCAAIDAQTDMTLERGTFPDYNNELEKNNHNEWYTFIRENYPERYEHLMKYGRRNISFTTAGPCGSLSILSRTSSGIEPLFMPYYTRRRKCVTPEDRVDYTDKMGLNFMEFVVVHPQLQKWAEINMPEYIDKFDNLTEKEWQTIYEQSPWYGACAQDIDWLKRVELQGIVQRNLVTHSISSTVNLPNNVSEKEVSDIYINAWKNNLKGITVYRDGSREGIMVKKEKKREDDKFESYVSAPKRPKSLPADFYVTRVKGETFFVMVGLYHEKPYEIFVYKINENEKSSYTQHRGEIIKMRKGVYKFVSEFLTIENINTRLNTEELATALYSSMLLRTGANLKYIIKTAQKVDDNIASFTAAMTRILKKYLKEEILEGEICPECGGRLVRENGCIKCIDCGYSKCG